MKKVVRLTESDLVRIVKRVIQEEVIDNTGSQYYTKVEGPFKDVGYRGSGTVYIMKLEKTLCRYSKTPSEFYNRIYVMTGSTCGEEYTTIPGGKFYIQQESEGKIKSFHHESRFYVSSTNNGQGFNTLEEAKKGVSLILNPQGKTGRQVEKGVDVHGTKYKQVTKYNQQGDVQKGKLSMTTSVGDKTVQKVKSGL